LNTVFHAFTFYFLLYKVIEICKYDLLHFIIKVMINVNNIFLLKMKENGGSHKLLKMAMHFCGARLRHVFRKLYSTDTKSKYMASNRIPFAIVCGGDLKEKVRFLLIFF
jgi:hypothetical protein